MVTARKLEQATAHYRKAFAALGYPASIARDASERLAVRLACFTGSEPVAPLKVTRGDCVHVGRPALVTYLDRQTMTVRAGLVVIQAQGQIDRASLADYLATVGRRPHTAASLAETIQKDVTKATGKPAFVSLDIDGEHFIMGSPLQ